MQPISNLNTLRPLYLILKHANPEKRGWGPHFLEKAAITNLNTWGSPPPPGTITHSITTVLVFIISLVLLAKLLRRSLGWII